MSLKAVSFFAIAFGIFVWGLPDGKAAQQTTLIECRFTEPFIAYKFDLQKRVITRISPLDTDPNNPSVFPEIIVATAFTVEQVSQDPFIPSFAIRTPDGQVHTTLTLNGNGSDGMSDIIYPYDAHHNGLWGGCESNVLKARKTDY